MGQQSLGLAAAYSAFQKFKSGGGRSSGDGKEDIMAMAMTEATKLFSSHKQRGGQADQDQVLATAAQAAMKLFNKN